MGAGEKNLNQGVSWGLFSTEMAILKMTIFVKALIKKTCFHEDVFRNIPIYTEKLEMTGNNVVPV